MQSDQVLSRYEFKRSGHETALKAADKLLLPESQFVIIETRPCLTRALERFKDESESVSFTDCMVMAVADDYGTQN